MTEETLFAAALEQGTPAARAAFLDDACSGDVALRRRLEALLHSHEHADFLKRPAVNRAAEELGGAPTAGMEAHPTEDDEANSSVDFLTPSEKPGSLGRLGHYEVLEIIGRGSMGIALKAFDDQLHRIVAIKVLAPGLANNGTARKRFVREARAAAAVRDEHVTAIYAVEEAAKVPYLVMEFIAGVSLQQRLDRAGPLEVREILRIGLQAAAGLAAAHAQGLIHRDIKPANILLENHVERVKITDFGLARAVDDASLTQEGVVAGTPQYMAPEQARGEALDHRADLFSLGSVLYALCTGQAPFRAETTLAVLKRVCEDTPRPIRESNPEVPEWLVEIVARLQAKDPAERFQSAAEVGQLLGNQLAQLQRPLLALAPSLPVKPADPDRTAASRRTRWRIAAVVLVIALGVSGYLFGPAVYRLATNRDLLVIATDEPDVGGIAKRDGARQPPLPATTDPIDADEAAAEWVLQLGGRVDTGPGLWIAARSDLPQGPFRLTGIDLANKGQVTDAGLAHLNGLTELRLLFLDNTGISDAGLEHLRGLELYELNLLGTKVTDAGLEQLKKLTKVNRLVLERTGISDAGLAHLKGLTGLRHLSLEGTAISDAGLEHLRGLIGLEKLTLDRTGVADAGLEHLKDLTGLQLLDLGDTGISDAGLKHLKGLTQLTYLHLGGTQVSDAGLVQLQGLTRLNWLLLAETRVTDAGLEYLKGLTGLQGLNLESTRVTDAGLVHLKGLTELDSLYLSGPLISDAGLEHLKGLTRLRLLGLTNARISDRGLEHLKGLDKLVYLNLGGTGVSEAGVRQLRTALPKCTISIVAEPPPNGAFVILAHGGKAEQILASLAEAVLTAGNGDTIEVRGDGPFSSSSVIPPRVHSQTVVMPQLAEPLAQLEFVAPAERCARPLSTRPACRAIASASPTAGRWPC